MCPLRIGEKIPHLYYIFKPMIICFFAKVRKREKHTGQTYEYADPYVFGAILSEDVLLHFHFDF